MKRTKIVGLALLTMFALSAVGATAAQAEFPVWKTTSGGVLTTGQTRNITSKKAGTAPFKLKTAALTIECQAETDKGQLIGGKPGQDTSKITFTECSLAGKTVSECSVNSLRGELGGTGEIRVSVKTVLAFNGTTKQRTLKADDAFFPEGTPKEGEKAAEPNLFVELELKNGSVGTAKCGALNAKKFKVHATGSEVKEVGGKAFGPRKCGVLAEVGEIVAGPPVTFKRTASGVMVTKGGLNFPEPALTNADELEETVTGYTNITCQLEVGEEVAILTGLSQEETEPAEAFGWEG